MTGYAQGDPSGSDSSDFGTSGNTHKANDLILQFYHFNWWDPYFKRREGEGGWGRWSCGLKIKSRQFVDYWVSPASSNNFGRLVDVYHKNFFSPRDATFSYSIACNYRTIATDLRYEYIKQKKSFRVGINRFYFALSTKERMKKVNKNPLIGNIKSTWKEPLATNDPLAK